MLRGVMTLAFVGVLGCESASLGECGDVDVIAIALEPPEGTSDLELSGAATLLGADPYDIQFDTGEQFRILGLRPGLPAGARVYVHLERHSDPPASPATRLAISELEGDTGRGDLIRAFWIGAPFLQGEFGNIAYTTEPSGYEVDACKGVKAVHRNLVVRMGSDKEEVGEECTARLGTYVLSHLRSFELERSATECEDVRRRYSIGSIVRAPLELNVGG